MSKTTLNLLMIPSIKNIYIVIGTKYQQKHNWTYWDVESFRDDFDIPLAAKLHFGLMDWVESKKFREAQNCPARALFNFIQDLSTSDTSSAKIADTFAPTALVLGGIPQCWDLQTPRDKVTSNSSNLWSSISSPTSLKKRFERSQLCFSLTHRETERLRW